MDATLSPNCTSAEPVHGSMTKWITRKKVGLIEACKLDQNCAVLQVFLYTRYLKGINRGRGPTVFEFAYRNADFSGSPKALLNTTNLALTHTISYNFCQIFPLNGDFKTK